MASDLQAEEEWEANQGAAAVVSAIVGVQVDERSFGECYENLSSAKKVLQDLSSTLQRVQAYEPDALGTTVYHLGQFLHFSLARPSLENGEALQRYLKNLRNSLDFRASWPREPLPDARTGTCLEGEDQLIFEHPSEGLIRLHWMNPLPKPAWLQHGGYQCDVCFDPDIQLGYQHVTEDNARDNSRLLEERTGYDLCVSCATRHILAYRGKVEKWIYSDIDSTYRRFVEDRAEISLAVSRSQESAVIEVAGSGGFHCAVAVMLKDDKLPTAWTSMGRKLAASPLPARTGSSSKVQFRCVKNGDTVSLSSNQSSGYQRGRLSFESSSPSKAGGEVHALQVAACEDEEGLWRLSFHPLGECAWLKEPQSLEEVRILASQAGCAHNISRKASDEMQLMRARANSDAAGANLSFATHGAGIKGGFFEPLSTDACAICLGSLGEQTWIRGEPWQTRCGHYFHRMCLRRHLRATTEAQRVDDGACPNCRLPGAALGTTNCPAKPLSWQVTEDIGSQSLQMDQEYRLLAVLCQDPEAVLHSSVVLMQKIVKFRDLPDEPR